MENKLISAIVTLTAVIILVATFMVPVIADAQETANPITMTNTTESAFPTGDYADEDFTITVTATADEDGYVAYVNGVGYAKPSTNIPMVIFDGNIIYLSQTSARATELMKGTSFSYDAGEVTITYTKSTNTLTYVGATANSTFTPESVFVWQQDGKYGGISAANGYSSVYTTQSNIENKTSGVYTAYGSMSISGATVSYTIISDKDGVTATFSNNEEYEVDLDFNNLEVVDGTYDILSGGTPSFVIHVDDTTEVSVSPVKYYVLTEVEGHSSEGSIVNLLGVVPVLIIAATVVSAVALLRGKNE